MIFSATQGCNNVSNGYNIIPTLQRCVALILVVANRPGEGTENGKKAIGLNWQNNNFARASCFCVHFFAATARLQRETA